LKEAKAKPPYLEGVTRLSHDDADVRRVLEADEIREVMQEILYGTS